MDGRFEPTAENITKFNDFFKSFVPPADKDKVEYNEVKGTINKEVEKALLANFKNPDSFNNQINSNDRIPYNMKKKAISLAQEHVFSKNQMNLFPPAKPATPAPPLPVRKTTPPPIITPNLTVDTKAEPPANVIKLFNDFAPKFTNFPAACYKPDGSGIRGRVNKYIEEAFFDAFKGGINLNARSEFERNIHNLCAVSKIDYAKGESIKNMLFPLLDQMGITPPPKPVRTARNDYGEPISDKLKSAISEDLKLEPIMKLEDPSRYTDKKVILDNLDNIKWAPLLTDDDKKYCANLCKLFFNGFTVKNHFFDANVDFEDQLAVNEIILAIKDSLLTAHAGENLDPLTQEHIKFLIQTQKI